MSEPNESIIVDYLTQIVEEGGRPPEHI